MIKRGAVLLSIVLALGFSSRLWAQSATLQALPTPANSEGVSYGTVPTLHGRAWETSEMRKRAWRRVSKQGMLFSFGWQQKRAGLDPDHEA